MSSAHTSSENLAYFDALLVFPSVGLEAVQLVQPLKHHLGPRLRIAFEINKIYLSNTSAHMFKSFSSS